MNSFWMAAPMVRVLIPFIGGIGVSLLTPWSVPRFWLIPLVGVLLLTVFLLYRSNQGSRHWQTACGVAFTTGLFLLGWEWCLALNPTFHPDYFEHLHQPGEAVSGRVLKGPVKRTNGYEVKVAIEAVRTTKGWQRSVGQALVYLPADHVSDALKAGDQLLFRAHFKTPSAPRNPDAFNYRRYLSHRLIFHQANIKAEAWVRSGQPSGAYFSDAWRNHLIGCINRFVPDSSSKAVAAALILGYKNQLDAELKQNYSKAGAMHVLAVSGLHVGMVYLLLRFLLCFLKRWKHGKWVTALLLITGLWTYALLTGLSPSVMRASTMFSFIIAGNALRRPVNIYNSIASSAFFLLLFTPRLLVDVGFQLSYLAVIGIVYLHPKLSALWIPRWKVLRWFWSLTCVSLAAQLATFPLGLFYFHQFPNYFLLSNLVVIPAATLILYTGVVLLLASPLVSLARWTGRVLSWLIEGLNTVIAWIEGLPGATTEPIFILWWEVVLIYLGMVCLLAFPERKQVRWMQGALGIGLVLITHQIIEVYQHRKQRKMIVYDIRRTTAISLIGGKNHVLLAPLPPDENQWKRKIRNHWMRLGLNHELQLDIRNMHTRLKAKEPCRISKPEVFQKAGFTGFYDLKIAIITPEFEWPDAPEQIAVDVVILSGNPKVNVPQLGRYFQLKQLVIDSSNGWKRTQKWEEEATQTGILTHVVRKKGAFILDL